jgi:hypothetical protein
MMLARRNLRVRNMMELDWIFLVMVIAALFLLLKPPPNYNG